MELKVAINIAFAFVLTLTASGQTICSGTISGLTSPGLNLVANVRNSQCVVRDSSFSGPLKIYGGPSTATKRLWFYNVNAKSVEISDVGTLVDGRIGAGFVNTTVTDVVKINKLREKIRINSLFTPKLELKDTWGILMEPAFSKVTPRISESIKVENHFGVSIWP